MKYLKPLFVLGLSLGVGACAPSSEPYSSHEMTGSDDTLGILNGTPVETRTTAAAKSVILIELLNSKGEALSYCSGVLIGPNTALTAAHCFDQNVIPGAAKFNILFNEIYRRVGPVHIARKGLNFKTHPKYNSAKHETPVYDHDIAVLVFAGTAPKGFEAAAMETNTAVDYSNSKVYSYGYGRFTDFTGRPHEEYTGGGGVLRRGEMKVDADYKGIADYYFTVDKTTARICRGDSGGPQFFQSKSDLKLIGIHSTTWGHPLKSGNSTCDGRSQITKVGYFYQWILDEQAKLLRKHN